LHLPAKHGIKLGADIETKTQSTNILAIILIIAVVIGLPLGYASAGAFLGRGVACFSLAGVTFSFELQSNALSRMWCISESVTKAILTNIPHFLTGTPDHMGLLARDC